MLFFIATVISLDAQASYAAVAVVAAAQSVWDKVVGALKWVIFVFIGLCFATSIVGKAYSKQIGSDNVNSFKILFFALYSWDFYSDIMFCARLADAAEWILFALSLLFIVVPWSANLVQLFRAQKHWTMDSSVQEGVRGWLVDWSVVLVIAVIFSGNSFGAVELANVCTPCFERKSFSD